MNDEKTEMASDFENQISPELKPRLPIGPLSAECFKSRYGGHVIVPIGYFLRY